VSDTDALLQDTVDTHVHSAPDLVPRKLDDFEVARQARDQGMAAIVLKNHFLSTALRAQLVEQQVGGIRVFGSVVLNQPMGGMNPWAVEAAARGGAKVVWMPTFQAENQIEFERTPGNPPHRAQMQVADRHAGVEVFQPDGALTADAEAVLEVIRDRGLILASGHLSPDEVDRLTARAIAMGLRKIVLTHPDFKEIAMPVELQMRLVERGVRFERTYNIINPPHADLTFPELAARIREVGYASTLLATDFGQTHNPSPAEGFRAYVEGLVEHGFAPDEIRRMGRDNAHELLDL
jgi:hypothetical protein